MKNKLLTNNITTHNKTMLEVGEAVGETCNTIKTKIKLGLA